jgi:hypothetical protein
MKVKKSWNPIVMDYENTVVEINEPTSPNDLVQRGIVVFDRPTMLMVNGEFWSRRDWDCQLPQACTCRFVELPRGGGGGSNPLQIIATIAILIIAIYAPGALGLVGLWGSLASAAIMVGGSLLLNMLFPTNLNNTSGDTSLDVGGLSSGYSYGAPNSIYSISQGSNNLRIGSPFTEHFGRMLLYPDLAQVSYVRIENNDQYLYFLGIIGIGEYSIEGVFIDDTPLLDFDGTSYNIVPPGNYLTLIPDIVWTCPAVSGQEVTPDYFTCSVSAAGTSTFYIEYDIMFASGLCAYNSLGEIMEVSVSITAHVRLINNNGVALTSWVTLHQITYTDASKDPVRYSNKLPAPYGPGRYEFRVSRANVAGDTSQFEDYWSGGELEPLTRMGYIAASIRLKCRMSSIFLPLMVKR